MPWSLFDILLSLPAYALVLARLTGLVLSAPVFGSTQIPTRIRGALTLVTAAMIYPVASLPAPDEMTLATVIPGMVGEMMIGISIGLSLSILLSGAQVAGVLVGQQAGLALSQVFDPTLNDRSSIVGQVYTIAFTTLFLVAGGHRAAMAALLDTYAVIPINSFSFNDSLVLLLVEMLTAAFVIGIRLAAPVAIALFLTALALGFLSRTMPQLNILTVGFTVRVMAAIGVAALALSGCQEFLLNGTFDALELVRVVFGLDATRTRLVG